jgi:glycine cleavage system H lipoate-binding protein
MVAVFVLTLFLFFISIDLIVLKIQGKNHPAFEPSFPQFDLSAVVKNGFTIPSNIFLSKGHTWLKKDVDGLINIGIDEFGMTALGTLSIVNCAPVGKVLRRGETLFEGAYKNNSVKFLSPINGVVKFVNTDIIGKNISNPYENYGVRLFSNDYQENQEMFLSGNKAIDWMKKEYIKLEKFINDHSPKVELTGTTMFDGGSILNDAVFPLVDKSVNDFEKEFLSL